MHHLPPSLQLLSSGVVSVLHTPIIEGLKLHQPAVIIWCSWCPTHANLRGRTFISHGQNGTTLKPTFQSVFSSSVAWPFRQLPRKFQMSLFRMSITVQLSFLVKTYGRDNFANFEVRITKFFVYSQNNTPQLPTRPEFWFSDQNQIFHFYHISEHSGISVFPIFLIIKLHWQAPTPTHVPGVTHRSPVLVHTYILLGITNGPVQSSQGRTVLGVLITSITLQRGPASAPYSLPTGRPRLSVVLPQTLDSVCCYNANVHHRHRKDHKMNQGILGK